MISYVIEHKGQTNEEIKNWIKLNNYRLIKINEVVGIQRKEILIVNYDKNGNTTFCNKEQLSEGRTILRPVDTVYSS
jgi:adenine-specific DNA-methyltransferase